MREQISKQLIGQEIGSRIKYTIYAVKVKEFCQAIGETNPMYFDASIAQAREGYKKCPIPPTFQTAFLFWGYPTLYSDMRKIGINVDRMLHLKEEYSYHHPLFVDDTVSSAVKITDVKTGRMEMVTFSCQYHNQDGVHCLTSNFTIVIRPPDK